MLRMLMCSILYLGTQRCSLYRYTDYSLLYRKHNYSTVQYSINGVITGLALRQRRGDGCLAHGLHCYRFCPTAGPL